MKTNEHLWRQIFRLGEMMGDGLHYEPYAVGALNHCINLKVQNYE